jgi:Mn-dependent DtxR family transcriptional regulator
MASHPGQATPAPSLQPLSDVDRGAARYLLAIATLSMRGSDRITTGELQDYLNVTPATVTEKMSKLDGRGLVEHEKYRGVVLTDRGDAIAMQAGWRTCIVSTFFDRELDMTVDEETAFEIGFVLPTSGVFRLRELVGSSCLGLCPGSDDDSRVCVA